ncbi:MAG: restriction endonuclease subunit S [Flavobacteriales bacterium]|nr:restriction endonuclease subunit S [Flavobacteriales bacterium]
MMSEWKEYKLDEIADIYNNKRVPLSSIVRSKRQGKYPYYGASGIVDYIDDYIFDGDYILISEDGENLRSRKTPIAFRAQGKFWVNNHSHIIQGKDKFLNDWITYFFKNLNVSPYLTGAVQPKLNKENLLRIPIPIPDFESASIITEILSSLDDKIELNNNINKELENLAQTLFKQWFIDFEFPTEDGEPYQSSGGEMMESELGMIPKAWEVVTLNELLTVKYGKDHKHLLDGDVPLYGSGGIMRFVEKPLYSKDSILIPRKGTLSNLFYLSEPFWSVDTMFYTEIHNPIYGKYLFFLIKGLNLASMDVGSAVPSMTTKVLNGIKVLKPNDFVMLQFDKIASSIFEIMKHNNVENQELSNLRDTLLPKLISGEINVKDL